MRRKNCHDRSSVKDCRENQQRKTTGEGSIGRSPHLASRSQTGWGIRIIRSDPVQERRGQILRGLAEKSATTYAKKNKKSDAKMWNKEDSLSFQKGAKSLPYWGEKPVSGRKKRLGIRGMERDMLEAGTSAYTRKKKSYQLSSRKDFPGV